MQSVTVIVPVYNTSEYLRQCVMSIQAQTFRDFELLLVDDGSTDGSSLICDEIAEEYDNVRVFHKQNGGLSDARNFGVNRAANDWVCFIDSDDIVSPHFISTLIKPVMNDGAQMAAIPMGTSFRDSNVPEELLNREPDDDYSVLRPAEYIKAILYQHVANAAQFRLVKKAIVEESPFPKGLLYEDMATTYRFAHSCSEIGLLRTKDLYAYRINPQGITRSKYAHKKCESAIEVTKALKRDIDEWYPSLANAASSRCFSTLRTIYAQAHDAKSLDEEALWIELMKYAPDVSNDREARLKDRTTAWMALHSRSMLNHFCSACRLMGFMA